MIMYLFLYYASLYIMPGTYVGGSSIGLSTDFLVLLGIVGKSYRSTVKRKFSSLSKSVLKANSVFITAIVCAELQPKSN